MTQSLIPDPKGYDTPTPPPDLSALVDTRWQSNLFRPLLIAAVSTSLLIGPITLARLITGENRFYSLLPFFFLITLQAVYTRLWLADPKYRLHRDYRVQLGEMVVWLIILRLITWYIHRQPLDISVWQEWLWSPAQFFDNLFIYSALMMFGAWKFAGSIAATFVDMGLSADELIDYRATGHERAWVQALPANRLTLLEQFGEMWLWGGMVLIVTAALARIEFEPEPGKLFGIRTLGLPPEMILALLVYFLGGLILLSQGRLAFLRARWHREGTPGISRVSGTWQRYALLIILGVGLLASLLPFGSTFGLALIIEALIRVAMFIYFGILALIALLITAILSLFMGNSSGMREPSPRQPPELPPAPESALLSNIPPWLGGTVLWVILGLVALYLIYMFISRRAVVRSVSMAWLSRLALWWQALRGRAQLAWQRPRRITRPDFLKNLAVPEAPWRFVRLRNLSPTELTRYFYLSTLRRAGKQGLARGRSQTPLEYEQTMAEQWPDVDSDMHQLTASFLQARYTAAFVDEKEAGRARVAWEALKRALRTRRKDKPEEDQ